MTETNVDIEKVEKEDIQPPELGAGDTAIIFQRHERYNRDRDAEDAGSIGSEEAELMEKRDEEFFRVMLAQSEADGIPTYVLFVSSDTQYAGKGRRSMETGQLAQNAATSVMEELGLDPNEQILNLNPNFSTKAFEPTDQEIRPMPGIREPQIFEDSDEAYLAHLQTKYGNAAGGNETGLDKGLSPKAWGMHEADLEKEMRESTGTESVHDMLDRTKHTMALLSRYADLFHHSNRDTRLVIWATSHYDTISPLVKDATDKSFEEYVPVDYGGGVVITRTADKETTLKVSGEDIPVNFTE